MDFQVLRVIFTPVTKQFFQAFLCLPLRCDDIATIDIDRQLSLQVQVTQAFVNLLIERMESSRIAGVKDSSYAMLQTKFDPAVKRCVNLFIRQVDGIVKK